MADNRKLKFIQEDQRLERGFVDGPCVFVTEDEDGNTVNIPIYAVTLASIDGQYHVGRAETSGTRFYPIDKVSDVKISESRGTITFSSYGNIYKVRAFQESDGSWASRLGAVVPVESLEERYMANVENAFSPNAPADDENLYVAVDDSGAVKHLVYSCSEGLYIRSNEGWFKVPVGDESLDDLTVMEMDPKIIKVYDMSEGDNQPLTADDVKRYEVEFRGGI